MNDLFYKEHILKINEHIYLLNSLQKMSEQ
jgi:hypothetical protein